MISNQSQYQPMKRKPTSVTNRRMFRWLYFLKMALVSGALNTGWITVTKKDFHCYQTGAIVRGFDSQSLLHFDLRCNSSIFRGDVSSFHHMHSKCQRSFANLWGILSKKIYIFAEYSFLFIKSNWIWTSKWRETSTKSRLDPPTRRFRWGCIPWKIERNVHDVHVRRIAI